MKNLNLNIYLLILALSLIFTSCEKKETPLTLPATKGDLKNYTLRLGKDYTTQLYFTIEDGKVKGNDFQVWDLAFDCSANGKLILVNGGKEVQVSETDCKTLGEPFNPLNAEWNWDNPSGEWNGTAIGNWWDSLTNKSLDKIYLIDRGVLEVNRYKKLRIISVSPTSFFIQHANLDGTEISSCEVKKLNAKNYVYFNFDKPNETIDLEPEKHSWDLIFTRYRHVYYEMNPIVPYSVTGVLLNPNKVVCYKDSLIGFNQIDINVAKQFTLSNKKDIIGFDWKNYDFALGRFDVIRKYTYIIKDTKGIYYKLRFIDFYDEQGLKGAPKFEIQRL